MHFADRSAKVKRRKQNCISAYGKWFLLVIIIVEVVAVARTRQYFVVIAVALAKQKYGNHTFSAGQIMCEDQEQIWIRKYGAHQPMLIGTML